MSGSPPHWDVRPVSTRLSKEIRRTIDAKTKPLGALGRLEELAAQICAVQDTLRPSVVSPHIVVFAGDHGVAHEGLSAYPQSVTYQMVYNFLAGGAGINVFARQHDIALQVVDAGVNHDFANVSGLIHEKVAKGTRNFLHGPAMTREQCIDAMGRGAKRVEALKGTGCNVIGFGEMGIANTSSAAVIMSLLCRLPINACVGRGAGLDDAGVLRKTEVLEAAVRQQAVGVEPLTVLATYGGFEIAMMCGAMLRAAGNGMLILVDGFISTVALLVAHRFENHVLDYCVFSHLSAEAGHRGMLRYLGGEPLFQLDMRLGEGTGAALAMPLVRAAVNFMNEMASFDSAGVSGKKC